MRIRLIIPTLACAGVFVTAEAQAFTLHRIAASLGVRHIASLDVSNMATGLAGANLSLDTQHAVTTQFVELTDAPSTEIEVRFVTECDAEIEVVNEQGVRVCNARVHMPAGVQKLGFCGRDAQGLALPNGVYYYNVIVGDDVSTTRITIVR